MVSRNVLPREQSAPFGDVEKEVVLEATSGPWELLSGVFSPLATAKQGSTP